MAEEFFVLENNFLPISDAMVRAVGLIIKTTAFHIEARAKQLAPVDYGFLRSSIYCEFHDGSGYGAGFLEPRNEGDQLPEVERPPDATTAYVAVGASYGVYQELGTSKMAAHPFLIPAAEAERAAYNMALESLEERMRQVGI